MSKRFNYYLILAASICLSLGGQSVAAAPELYSLLGRSTVGHMELTLDKTQWQWIRDKRELLLGTSAPDYPPFDLTLTGRDYEGFTADYANIISRALDLPIKVRRFESRQAAMAALDAGQIDLLGSANGFEAINRKIRLSIPYAIDQPVLVTRIGETRSLTDGLAGMRLSMVYHYLPPAEIETLYPKAALKTYPSFQSAINAVAFNQADVFLGDTISTQYMINKGYLNNIQMANFGKHEPSGFSFAVDADNTQLLDIINSTLKAIPVEERIAISKRWGASDLMLTDQKLQLTHREERWIAQHPAVRVVINESYAPLTFLDASGNFRGITADLLELVRLRTGLRFEITRAASLADMMNQVRQGQADVISALISSDEREDQFSFTRPYIDNSFVLVTRKWPENSINLGQLSGKRVAVTLGSPILPFLRREFPSVVPIEVDNPFQTLEMLAQGRVEGAIASLVSANYFLTSGVFEDRLQITTTVGDEPALISMATSRKATELSSILDKALSSIAPHELAAINNRWRSFTPAGGNWQDYQRQIYQIVLGAGLLLLGSLAWIAYMRRQIKQREQAERALNDQFEFMRALVDGTPHPIYVRDREGLLRMCNDSYLKAFDVQRAEIIDKSVTEGVLSNVFEAREYASDYQEVMATGNSMILDRTLQIDDRLLTIYHWILPFRDSLGEVQGIIGGWIDISERRQLIEELRAAKDQADNANRAKSTFLATMSHEIRTPMNAVIGMLELALKRADQGHLDRPAVEVAYSSAKDLLELIGDILDIARIESGRLTLSPERANLRQLVESVVRVFDGLARQKSLSLLLDLDSGINTDVLIDPLRFKQILSNLTSNAIKFTEQGQVKITLHTESGADTRSLLLRMRVQDTGVGISEQDQQRLFEPFAQADNAGQQARTGAGLGLVICRSLCEMMGGTLELSSEQGQGTQVNMTFNLTTLEPLAPSAVRHENLALADSTLNILVVDDHPANSLLLCQQLEFLGHRCAVAEQGAQGLALWHAGDFDVVVTDCNMPIMNGYELTRAIRAHELEHQRPPCTIWGFTANALPEEKLRCRDAGMDDCLFKPVSLTSLSEHLNKVHPGHEAVMEAVSILPQQAFNMGSVSALTGERPEMTRRLLEQMLASSEEDRLELTVLVPDDASELHRLAHRIKGAARIIRATRVIETCEALESVSPGTTTKDVIKERQRAIVAAMLDLEHALREELNRAA
jgi:two-component system sensor histidine kinase EvgS